MNLNTRATRPLALLSVFAAMAGCQPPSTSGDKGMEQFASDKDFHAAHTLKQTENVQLQGKDIELAVGTRKAKAYWVAPKAGQTQGVVMIHEWWGLNENIRQFADKLHDKEGYGVLAVDLYEGKVATNADDAGKYMAAVDEAKSVETVNAALNALEKGVDGSAPCTKIGTIGFCFGGGWSQRAAILGSENVQACVVFYGMPSSKPDDLARLKAPVLFISGTQDKWITPKVVADYKKAMDAAGKPIESVPFNADHAFANPSSQSYKSKEAQEAWDKAFEFFKKNLG